MTRRWVTLAAGLVMVLMLTTFSSAAIQFAVSNLDLLAGGREAYQVPTLTQQELDDLVGGHALVIYDGVLKDINDLLPGNSGWESLMTASVTPFGQVAGIGKYDGDYHAFLMGIAGDANGDAKVDTGDLALWMTNYDPLGTNANGLWRGDWNGDGRVDSGDLAVWQSRYNPLGYVVSFQLTDPIMLNERIDDGQESDPIIPEPASLTLLMMSVAGAGLRVRRTLTRR